MIKNVHVMTGHWTHVPRNVNMEGLRSGYLFPEVLSLLLSCAITLLDSCSLILSNHVFFFFLIRNMLLNHWQLTGCFHSSGPLNQISIREHEHIQKNPNARLIRLGIGDTTQPIPDIITTAMAEVTSSPRPFGETELLTNFVLGSVNIQVPFSCSMQMLCQLREVTEDMEQSRATWYI